MINKDKMAPYKSNKTPLPPSLYSLIDNRIPVRENFTVLVYQDHICSLPPLHHGQTRQQALDHRVHILGAFLDPQH